MPYISNNNLLSLDLSPRFESKACCETFNATSDLYFVRAHLLKPSVVVTTCFIWILSPNFENKACCETSNSTSDLYVVRAHLLKPSVVVTHVCQPIPQFVVNKFFLSKNEETKDSDSEEDLCPPRFVSDQATSRTTKGGSKITHPKGNFFRTLGSNGCAANKM